MSMRQVSGRGRQHGIVLIASLLLLLVITILALAMFRSMGLGEKIAGNVREKQRALHAAAVAGADQMKFIRKSSAVRIGIEVQHQGANALGLGRGDGRDLFLAGAQDQKRLHDISIPPLILRVWPVT